MATGAPHLDVAEERLWHGVGVERPWFPDLSHSLILNDGEDKLLSLVLRRLIGAAVGALGLVRRFRACADDSRDIIIDYCVVGYNACCFGKLCSIARCVSFHRPNEADGVVGSLRFLVGGLDEEQRQNLPDLRKVGV